jgi:hypothetical protein
LLEFSPNEHFLLSVGSSSKSTEVAYKFGLLFPRKKVLCNKKMGWNTTWVFFTITSVHPENMYAGVSQYPPAFSLKKSLCLKLLE